jgi:leucyl-tRNA synthetase
VGGDGRGQIDPPGGGQADELLHMLEAGAVVTADLAAPEAEPGAVAFETLQFNTPVAALMELSNALYDFKVEPETATDPDVSAIREAVEALILMLTPFAPHTAEELYSQIVGNADGILANEARFPVYREELAKADEIEIPVQINGKLRSRVLASPDASNEELEKMALADEKVGEWTNGKQIVKVVVVPKRLVNIVVK